MADFIVDIPIANSLRYTEQEKPDNQRANFDQVRFSQAEHANMQQRKYLQPFEKTDVIREQFYTNFLNKRVRVLDCSGEAVLEPSILLAKQYQNKFYWSDCKFVSYQGKLFIYFDSGSTYTDETFLTVASSYDLLGRLPNINAKAGNAIRYQIQNLGFESAVIDSIVWNVDLKVEGFLLDIAYAGSEEVGGVVEVNYNEKDANLYYFNPEWSSLDEGVYYVELSFGNLTYEHIFLSEPIDLATEHKKSLALKYRHSGELSQDDLWAYVYVGSDWYNIIRFDSRFHQFVPSGELEQFVADFGKTSQTFAAPYRQLIFKAFNIPSWLADKINVVWGHDKVVINDYSWRSEDFGSFELVENTDIGTYEIQVRQVEDRTIKASRYSEILSAEFIPSSFSDIMWEGDTLVTLFQTNVSGYFRFITLPSWIGAILVNDADYDEFRNGDTVKLVVDENETLFPRMTTLIAKSDDFNDLTASLSLSQNFDNTTEPEYISAEPVPVEVGEQNGNNVLINVSSSGDYSISLQAGYNGYNIQKEDGFTKLRITATEDNDSNTDRAALIRLTLDSNPTIYFEFNVTQVQIENSGILISVSPTVWLPSAPAASRFFTVEAGTECQWQASSNQPWLTIDPSIKVGYQVVIAFVSQNNTPSTRIANLTFTNVNDANNKITVTVVQTGA